MAAPRVDIKTTMGSFVVEVSSPATAALLAGAQPLSHSALSRSSRGLALAAAVASGRASRGSAALMPKRWGRPTGTLPGCGLGYTRALSSLRCWLAGAAGSSHGSNQQGHRGGRVGQ